jgi:hypothetical protein
MTCKPDSDVDSAPPSDEELAAQVLRSAQNRRARPLTPDEQLIKAGIDLFHPDVGLVELRWPNRIACSEDFAWLAKQAKKCDDDIKTDGSQAPVWMNLNQLRSVPAGENVVDSDISEYRWLFLDFDAEAPAGLSSTQDEHDQAHQRAKACREFLRDRGWPDPVYASSGNGAWLLYRVDVPTDQAGVELIKSILEALHSQGHVVDLKTFNPGRLIKIPGTTARKGPNSPDRPHRKCEVLNKPDPVVPVSREQLESLVHDYATEAHPAQPSPAPPTRTKPSPQTKPSPTNYRDLDHPRTPEEVEAYLASQGISHGPRKKADNGCLWTFEVCPLDPDDHGEPHKAFFQLFDDGTPRIACHAAGCKGRERVGWKAIHELSNGPSSPRLLTTRADQVKMKPQQWIAREIPRGAMTILTGNGGAGKSSILLDLIACLSNGKPCFGQAKSFLPPCGSIVIQSEDQLDSTVVPRLRAFGADLSKVNFITDVDPGNGEEIRPFLLTDVALLRSILAEQKDVRLVVIDPCGDFLPPDMKDDFSSVQIRQILSPLKRLAQEADVAIVLVKHPNKTGSKTGRVSGSADYRNLARSVVNVDPKGDGGVLTVDKHNLSPGSTKLEFTRHSLTPQEAKDILSPIEAELEPDDLSQIQAGLFRIEWKAAPQRTTTCRSPDPTEKSERVLRILRQSSKPLNQNGVRKWTKAEGSELSGDDTKVALVWLVENKKAYQISEKPGYYAPVRELSSVA